MDLDPNDGIDPSLTFLASSATQQSHGMLAIDGPGASASDLRQGANAFAPLSINVSNAAGSGSGAMSGSLDSAFSMQAAGSLVGLPGNSSLSNELSTGYLGFVLSPMTAVTFSARVMMSLGLEGSPPVSGASTTVVRLDVHGDLAGANEPWNQVASLSTTAGSKTYDSPLTLTLANALGAVTTNDLQFSSSIAEQVAAPVPEPTTWAMFLGGLAMLAAHARRRWWQTARSRG